MTPDLPGAFRGRRKERFVSFVGRVILLDEIANVDLRDEIPAKGKSFFLER
jgi:hypothetical protein